MNIEAMCKGKAFFPTFDRAARKSRLRHLGHAYKCTHCNGYHIGTSIGKLRRKGIREVGLN